MQILKIRGRLPGYNEYNSDRRGNKYKRNREKQDVEQLIAWSARRQKIRPEEGPCFFVFEWHEKTKAKSRDPDNIAFAKKFIFDRLQKVNVIEDDTAYQVRGFSDRFIYDKSQGVVVYIIPEAEAGEMEASAWKI